ncbi:MAG: hypothetical protein WCD42_05215 [Rhizomicrobium sp.]
MLLEGAATWPALPPELTALQAWWTDKCDHGAKLPAGGFGVDMLEPWQNNVAWIERIPSGRFRIDYCGLSLIRRLGREATNSYIDTLASDIFTLLQDALTRCVASGAPVVMRPYIALGDMRADHVDLVLPFGAAKSVSTLLFASYELASPF